jgi:hypothetical protein
VAGVPYEYPLNPSGSDDDSEGFTLPPRAGAGTLMGLRPADWVAMLGGLLSGVRIGSPQARAQGGGLRPGLALLPLAQGLEASDKQARSAEGVKALQSQYGGETDLPEFKTALLLANQGNWKDAMTLLGRGVTDRNTRAREARTAERTGQAAEGYGTAMRPVTEPGITGFRPATQEDLLAPPTTAPTRNWQDVDRPPEIGEIIDRLKTEIKDPVVRGLAFDKANQALAQRTQEEAKLRPRTEVKDNRFIRYDPRRGTAEAQAELPETTAQKAVRELREARKAKEVALTARAERDPNAPLGSALNPHVTHKIGVDPKTGQRGWMEFRSWVEQDPTAEGGVRRKSTVFPLGVGAPFKPPAPPSDRNVDYTTTTTRETPAQEIGGYDLLKNLNDALPGHVSKAAPGFVMPTTPTVTLPDGTKRSRQQVIDYTIDKIKAHYLKQDPPLAVEVRENKGQFVIVRALRPGQVLESTSARTRGVGPRRPAPAGSGDDAEE